MALYNVHDHWPTSLCLNNCRVNASVLGVRSTYKVNWSQVQQINNRSFDWQGRKGVGFPEIALFWVPLMRTSDNLVWPGPYRLSRRRADPVLCYEPWTQLLMLNFHENDLFYKYLHSFIPSQVFVFAKTRALRHYTSIMYRIRFLNFSP